jgi:hypothetical protein
MRSEFRLKWIVFLALVLALPRVVEAGQPRIDEIIERSLAATQADWEAAPRFSYFERDRNARGGKQTAKTYQVLMIDGSPYQRLVAINGEPLTAPLRAREGKKLREEIARRANESPQARARRLAQYRKSRKRMFTLMHAMVDAFNFKLVSRERVAGYETWVLDATPRPGYQPTSRETKVLTGMQGRLWIDCQSYQWVKAEAEVLKPVWFGWFLAKIGPGTRFLLEQSPVTENLWQPAHFRVAVKASILWMHRNFVQDTVYRDYRWVGGSASGAEDEAPNSPRR